MMRYYKLLWFFYRIYNNFLFSYYKLCRYKGQKAGKLHITVPIYFKKYQNCFIIGLHSPRMPTQEFDKGESVFWKIISEEELTWLKAVLVKQEVLTGGMTSNGQCRFWMVEVKTSNFRPLPMPVPYKEIGEWRLCVQRVRPA